MTALRDANCAYDAVHNLEHEQNQQIARLQQAAKILSGRWTEARRRRDEALAAESTACAKAQSYKAASVSSNSR
eukprot:3410323-Prymnesium_polylepis.1